jgi:LPS sulfotransferase NodH
LGSYYQELDRASFDYELQTLPDIPLETFRGPVFDPTRPYVACIGAAQTFGRFCAKPYPSILSAKCDFQFLNLAVGGAGPRLFASAGYLTYLNNAEFVIVQVLAGRSEGNSLFDNTGTGGLFGFRLKDNKRMRFEDFLSDLVETQSADVVAQVVRETQSNYVKSYVRLLNQIHRPKVLLWISNRRPDHPEDLTWRTLGAYPHLVNRAMLNEIRRYGDVYVECVSTAGVPQELWEADKPIDGAELEQGKLMNYYYPTPAMHIEVAEALEPICRHFLPKQNDTMDQLPPNGRSQYTMTKFIILAAERSGSDLLRGLLDSHPDCFVGQEIFNEVYFEQGCVPWYIDPETGRHQENPANYDSELVDLRAKDPGRLIERLMEMAREKKFHAAGFKLMYYHGENKQAARTYLVSSPDVRIIHLKRKNLLRRLVSLKRAQAADAWNVGLGSPRPTFKPVELSAMECVADFSEIERQQTLYDDLFKNHALINVYYEDLAENPQKEAARAAAFLGLKPFDEFEIRFKKLAIEPLAHAVPRYAELKTVFDRWASFFDE